MGLPDMDLVLRTARLARLEIDPAQVEALSAQFVRILEAFQVISSVDLAAIEPPSGSSGASDVVREDRPRPGLDRELLLSNAPAREGEFFRVPRTVGGER